MRIGNTRTVFENDDTPEKETIAYAEQDLVCRNKECQEFNQVVEVVRHKLK